MVTLLAIPKSLWLCCSRDTAAVVVVVADIISRLRCGLRVLGALFLKVSVAQAVATMGFHIIAQVGVIKRRIMFNPRGGLNNWGEVSLGGYMHTVCFVVCC